MRRWILLLATVCGCHAGARAELSPALARAEFDQQEFSEPARSRPTVEWHLDVETLGRGVGAYTITLRYDRDIAVIQEIRVRDPRHFKGTPEYDPATLASGVTRVTALDAFPARPPESPVRLLTVVFKRVRGGRFTATAELEKLYDDSDRGRPLPGRLSRPRFDHVFPSTAP
jgi:hypothetical protein